MKVEMKYASASEIRQLSGGGKLVQMTPNLARHKVAFDGDLKRPIEFREAISALHDVVINDLRFVPRDQSAYEAWVVQQRKQDREIYASAREGKQREINEGRVARSVTVTESYMRRLAIGRYRKARAPVLHFPT